MEYIKRNSLILGLFLLIMFSIAGWLVSRFTKTEEILAAPIEISGEKNIVRNEQILPSGILVGKETLVLTYNLHGVCILEGPASALSLIAIDGRTYSVSLARYGQNCADGVQTVKVPLQDFFVNQPLVNMKSIAIQFWYPTAYDIDIQNINTNEPSLLGFSAEDAREFLMGKLVSPQSKIPRITITRARPNPPLPPKPPVIEPPPPAPVPPIITPPPVVTPPPAPLPVPPAPIPPPIVAPVPPTPVPPVVVPPTTTNAAWAIRSVSSMKETKDKICGQDQPLFINAWVGKAVEIGANYIAVETPYDNPACGNSLAYTKVWSDAIHARGLSVWHRHMPLAFEGIYNTPKNNSNNYIQLISNYIKANPTVFKAGDIFTPIPEPQNGGIAGVTYCPQNICMFPNAAAFNKWLRDAITASESAFASIGLGGKMKIGYYGFDGFVAWGDNNPDWNGILEDATVSAMGNITIDHYPEIVGDTMENDLNELQTKYPNTPIVIGEWGTITGGDVVSQVQKSMQAAIRKNVIGFNYWHMGMGGNESLINDGMINKLAFSAVKSLFTR
ncbi:MAG: hypothetical protein AAB783_01855 [Patescibacteria group bacterium]